MTLGTLIKFNQNRKYILTNPMKMKFSRRIPPFYPVKISIIIMFIKVKQHDSKLLNCILYQWVNKSWGEGQYINDSAMQLNVRITLVWSGEHSKTRFTEIKTARHQYFVFYRHHKYLTIHKNVLKLVNK